MYELGFEEDMADRDEVEGRFLARLMPESYEWPRYDTGEPVRIGDVVSDVEVRSVVFRDDGILLSDCTSVPGWGTWRSYKEPIKRPAVLAADGEPLEVGQTVWHVSNGIEFTVVGLPKSGEYQAVKLRLDDGAFTGLDPDQLTHQRPVLDVDGVPIKKGDTVYLLPGEWCDEFPCLGFHGGEELEVFDDGEAAHVSGGVQCREKGASHCYTCYPQPSQLTHTKPEPLDSWERIEADCAKADVDYCDERGLLDTSCNKDEGDGSSRHCTDCGCTCGEKMARDIVRRCRALAERERGE